MKPEVALQNDVRSWVNLCIKKFKPQKIPTYLGPEKITIQDEYQKKYKSSMGIGKKNPLSLVCFLEMQTPPR